MKLFLLATVLSVTSGQIVNKGIDSQNVHDSFKFQDRRVFSSNLRKIVKKEPTLMVRIEPEYENKQMRFKVMKEVTKKNEYNVRGNNAYFVKVLPWKTYDRK